VLQQDQPRLIAAFQPRPYIAAPGCALCRLIGNAFGFQDLGDEFDRAGLVAGWIGGVDLDECLQPVECLVFDGLGGYKCL
jgi:hypothetical protein